MSVPAKRKLTRAEALDRLEDLLAMGPVARHAVLRALGPGAVRALEEEWAWQAHEGQFEPPASAGSGPGDWRIWTIVAGRGFGKTRAGAEWVWARARAHPGARIALVAAGLDEVAKVMIEGDSGLIACARRGERVRWTSSRGEFEFPSGATAFAHTAARPERLRGPQHHFAWCDELAKWPHEAAWDNLMLGLRLGRAPRAIVTTTPQAASPLLKRVLALPRSVETKGRTDDNPHLAGGFVAAMRAAYGATRLGRQELDGLLFDDPEGALWTREMLEAARVPAGAPMARVVIGVDPPASATGDACGIVVCGIDGSGTVHVLADLTVQGLRPEGWARRVAAAAEMWDAQLVVAEKNQGGDMIESVLRGVDSALPVRLASASLAKAARAEPVALRFETGGAKLAGAFPELEDELCQMTYAGYLGQGSPDRADAMVWAMSALLRPGRAPRVRGLWAGA